MSHEGGGLGGGQGVGRAREGVRGAGDQKGGQCGPEGAVRPGWGKGVSGAGKGGGQGGAGGGGERGGQL